MVPRLPFSLLHPPSSIFTSRNKGKNENSTFFHVLLVSYKYILTLMRLSGLLYSLSTCLPLDEDTLFCPRCVFCRIGNSHKETERLSSILIISLRSRTCYYSNEQANGKGKQKNFEKKGKKM